MLAFGPGGNCGVAHKLIRNRRRDRITRSRHGTRADRSPSCALDSALTPGPSSHGAHVCGAAHPNGLLKQINGTLLRLSSARRLLSRLLPGTAIIAIRKDVAPMAPPTLGAHDGSVVAGIDQTEWFEINGGWPSRATASTICTGSDRRYWKLVVRYYGFAGRRPCDGYSDLADERVAAQPRRLPENLSLAHPIAFRSAKMNMVRSERCCAGPRRQISGRAGFGSL